MTPDDSLAFCEWLTELHAGSGEWYFRLPKEGEINDEKFSDLSVFWIFSETERQISAGIKNVDIWRNPVLPREGIPIQFMRKTVESDIKSVISTLRTDDTNLNKPENDLYLQLNAVLKRMLRLIAKPNRFLVEAADELFETIIQLPTSNAVDFGYGSIDPEAYDQSISDCIDRIEDHDFESGIMTSIKCFSNIIHSNPRATDWFKPIYIAFAFKFLAKWAGENKKLFVALNLSGIQRKVDFMLDWYVDRLIVHARQCNQTKPFEGLLFVKETRDR